MLGYMWRLSHPPWTHFIAGLLAHIIPPQRAYRPAWRPFHCAMRWVLPLQRFRTISMLQREHADHVSIDSSAQTTCRHAKRMGFQTLVYGKFKKFRTFIMSQRKTQGMFAFFALKMSTGSNKRYADMQNTRVFSVSCIWNCDSFAHSRSHNAKCKGCLHFLHWKYG